MNNHLKLEATTLNSDRLELIPVSYDYLQDFHEYSSIENFYKYLEYSQFNTLDESKEYLTNLIERSKSNDTQFWFVKMKDNNKVIGSVGLYSLNVSRRSVEIGYGISPNYQGLGLFKEVLHAALGYCFGNLSLNRVQAITSSENTPSIAGLKKRGFIQEGTLREYYFNGEKSFDAALLSLIAKDLPGDIGY